MRALSYVACVMLLALAGGFTLLAIIATGGDSAFANTSRWIYTPWLVALALTLAAMVATVVGASRAALLIAAGASTAYATAWFVWDLFGSPT